MIEPTNIMTFQNKQKAAGPYAEKSEAELQMILNDATKYKDPGTIAKVNEEIATRRGVVNKPVVSTIEKIVKAAPKKETKKGKKTK